MRHAPRLFEFGADIRVRYRLISREHIRQSAMIASALHVVLAAHGTDPHAGPAEVAGQQSQAGQALDYIHRLSVMRDAHAVQE